MHEESATQHVPASDSPTRRPGAKLSAVELAALRGIGPMSPLGMKVWHGESFPCVSCGQLVRRSQIRCSECGEDLSLKMIMKMQAHAGPWYVHEHVRPFPGVTLERLIRQVHRGVLTLTTIVRGPTTYHQWRFAAETPALSKHLGVCWNCQAKVTPEDTHCGVCRVNLNQPAGLAPGMDPPDQEPPLDVAPAPSTTPREVAAGASSPVASGGGGGAAATVPTGPVGAPAVAAAAPAPTRDTAAEMARLQEALRSSTPAPPPVKGKSFPTGIIIAAIVVATVLGLLAVVKLRQRSRTTAVPPPATTAAPTEPVNGI